MRTAALLFTTLLGAAALLAACSDPPSGRAYEDLPEVVDVVALGGSNVGGYGIGGEEEAYPALYARSLAEEARIETRYVAHHTLQDMSNRHLRTWNDMLLVDEHLRADLRAAEIVTIEIGIHTVLLECGWYPNWTADCLSGAANTIADEYRRFFDRLDLLISDDTVVMAFNQGLPRPSSEHWRDHPDWESMKTDGFGAWWDALESAATAHGVIVIDTARMFGEGDPDEFGMGPEYMQPDNAHFNPTGHRVWADLLLDADTIGPGG